MCLVDCISWHLTLGTHDRINDLSRTFTKPFGDKKALTSDTTKLSVDCVF
jgi:hypothetical protein